MTGRLAKDKMEVITVHNGKITRTKPIGIRLMRTPTKRYGGRENDVNGDEFFHNLLATESSTSTSAENVQQLATETAAIHSMSPEIMTTDQKSSNRSFSRTSSISSEISSFLENRQQEINSSVSVESSQCHRFEEIVLRKLDEILIRVSQLEKNGAKNQVQVNVLTSEIDDIAEDRTNVVNELSTADIAILSEMGLPVKSVVALQELEDKLSKAEFVKSVVSMPLFSICTICKKKHLHSYHTWHFRMTF